jgi:hypothetical protein
MIIDAQDYALQKQKEKAEFSRMNAEWAVLGPGLARTGWRDF